MLSWMPAALSPVEYSFTGMETRPKEIIPEAKGRALIARNIPFNPRARRDVLQKSYGIFSGSPAVLHFTFRENPVLLRSHAKKRNGVPDPARELRAELARL